MEKTDTVVLENLHLRTVNAKLVEALERYRDEHDDNEEQKWGMGCGACNCDICLSARKVLKLAKGE